MSCRNLWQRFEGICGLAGKCIQAHGQERCEARAVGSAGVALWGWRAPVLSLAMAPSLPCREKGRDALGASPAGHRGTGAVSCSSSQPSPHGWGTQKQTQPAPVTAGR